ncbi:hypothetical protein T439DRAFT_323835 [Meredithblackwellia eburnea MCA 4105]
MRGAQRDLGARISGGRRDRESDLSRRINRSRSRSPRRQDDQRSSSKNEKNEPETGPRSLLERTREAKKDPPRGPSNPSNGGGRGGGGKNLIDRMKGVKASSYQPAKERAHTGKGEGKGGGRRASPPSSSKHPDDANGSHSSVQFSVHGAAQLPQPSTSSVRPQVTVPFSPPHAPAREDFPGAELADEYDMDLDGEEIDGVELTGPDMEEDPYERHGSTPPRPSSERESAHTPSYSPPPLTQRSVSPGLRYDAQRESLPSSAPGPSSAAISGQRLSALSRATSPLPSVLPSPTLANAVEPSSQEAPYSNMIDLTNDHDHQSPPPHSVAQVPTTSRPAPVPPLILAAASAAVASCSTNRSNRSTPLAPMPARLPVPTPPPVAPPSFIPDPPTSTSLEPTSSQSLNRGPPASLLSRQVISGLKDEERQLRRLVDSATTQEEVDDLWLRILDTHDKWVEMELNEDRIRRGR